ncbi:MAG TPA: LLM class flavin-dependent oxidoreductase [Alphaproteobacteria bacterium]|nr:LLM class flavin-dependent oxidoreductase [Alphaproteobacteria bacterium]
MLTLSVLDQSPIRKGGTAAQAIAETLELAQLCDRLGYHRYWLAEHHSSGGLAGSTPEILIGRVAGATRHLRVGSGGVMLSHYSPLKVAENFRMLETLYPGRIDLGIGRAPGSDQRTAHALAVGPGALGIEYFPHQIKFLMDFLADLVDEPDHPFRGIHAQPTGQGQPEFWLLGSSAESAAYAAHFGLPFSFAHFITGEGGERVMEAYRQRYQPSPEHPEPRGSVGVFVICADSEEEAEYLTLSRDLFLLKLRTGEPGPIPSPEEARGYPYDPQERLIVEMGRRRTIAGAPEQVRDRLSALAQAYGVEELVVVTITYDFAARKRSYELLAEAFGLTPRQ